MSQKNNKDKLKNILNQNSHMDRGNEFKNKYMNKTLKTSKMERSLSMKGCPYNSISVKSAYKIIKTAFIKNQVFCIIETTDLIIIDYILLLILVPKEFERHIFSFTKFIIVYVQHIFLPASHLRKRL